MANFNRVLLIGNLTRDVELSYTANQTAIGKFGLAVNRKWTDNAGQQHEKVMFVDCEAWGKTAQNLSQYCRKGSPIFIEGRLELDQWTAQDGSRRSKHKVTVENMQFLGTPPKQQTAPQQAPQWQPPPQQGPRVCNPPPAQNQWQPPSQLPDDDIPF